MRKVQSSLPVVARAVCWGLVDGIGQAQRGETPVPIIDHFFSPHEHYGRYGAMGVRSVCHALAGRGYGARGYGSGMGLSIVLPEALQSSSPTRHVAGEKMAGRFCSQI